MNDTSSRLAKKLRLLWPPQIILAQRRLSLLSSFQRLIFLDLRKGRHEKRSLKTFSFYPFLKTFFGLCCELLIVRQKIDIKWKADFIWWVRRLLYGILGETNKWSNLEIFSDVTTKFGDQSVRHDNLTELLVLSRSYAHEWLITLLLYSTELGSHS